MIRREEVDFAILTGSQEMFPESVGLPLYRWNRVVVVPKDHPLAADKPLTLQKLAAHPIVTYEFSFAGRSSLQAAFDTAGLTLDASLAAQDADVIKTYVRTGLGVGIVASMAVDARADSDLAVLDASHFLESHTTWLGFRRGLRLANYMYDFISELAPHLSRGLVRRAESATTQTAVDRMLRRVNVPWWGVFSPADLREIGTRSVPHPPIGRDGDVGRHRDANAAGP
jgi:LysR family cys regulon transcriptional activator